MRVRRENLCMNTHTTQKCVAALAALSLAATPAAAVASTHHTSPLRKKAEKYCRVLEKKEGKRKFDKKYGPKNAFGKCVSRYEKKHK